MLKRKGAVNGFLTMLKKLHFSYPEASLNSWAHSAFGNVYTSSSFLNFSPSTGLPASLGIDKEFPGEKRLWKFFVTVPIVLGRALDKISLSGGLTRLYALYPPAIAFE